jgi:hypothetical protein
MRQKADYMPGNKLAIARNNSQGGRYAVLELRWKETFPELVIAYCDEESLRKLIAAPNMIGIVFSSGQAGVAGVQDGSSNGTDSKKVPEWQTSEREAGDRELQSQPCLLQLRIGLGDIRRIAFESAQRAVAAGILMFYSTNILGAAIRALVGA